MSPPIAQWLKSTHRQSPTRQLAGQRRNLVCDLMSYTLMSSRRTSASVAGDALIGWRGPSPSLRSLLLFWRSCFPGCRMIDRTSLDMPLSTCPHRRSCRLCPLYPGKPRRTCRPGADVSVKDERGRRSGGTVMTLRFMEGSADAVRKPSSSRGCARGGASSGCWMMSGSSMPRGSRPRGSCRPAPPHALPPHAQGQGARSFEDGLLGEARRKAATSARLDEIELGLAYRAVERRRGGRGGHDRQRAAWGGAPGGDSRDGAVRPPRGATLDRSWGAMGRKVPAGIDTRAVVRWRHGCCATAQSVAEQHDALRSAPRPRRPSLR